MQLRMATDYAIRGVLYLATHDGIITAQEISDYMGVTHNYTQQILRTLRKAEIVCSNMGNTGGYSLKKKPEEISLYEIMSQFENSMKINACLEDKSICTRKDKGDDCSVHKYYEQLQMQIDSATKKTTIRDLMNPYSKVNTFSMLKEEEDETVSKEEFADYMDHEKIVNEGLDRALSMGHPEESLKVLLKYFGEQLAAERAYIFEFRENGNADNTYEWCANGIKSEKDNLQNIPSDALSVWTYHFQSKNASLVIKDIEDTKYTDEKCYSYLKPQNIHSLVATPLIYGEELIGFFGIDNPPREMLNNVTTLLEIVGKFFTSIIRRRNLVKSLEDMNSRDSLTGLPNRRTGEENIRKQMYNGRMGVLMVISIDNFKAINEALGHRLGDQILIQVGDKLKKICRQTDILFRLGGNEFVIYYPTMYPNTVSESKCERVLKEVREEYIRNCKKVSITCSIGAAIYHGDNIIYDVLYRNADFALQKAIENNGDCFEIFEEAALK